MNKSDSIVNIGKAILAFQASVDSISRDSENPYFKKKYASLSNIQDEIKGPLIAAGLCYAQFPEGDESLTTLLLHAESGEFLESTYNIHASKKDPQGMGSAITYARRYALCAALGLNVEDDDGNGATKAKQAEQSPQNTSQQSNGNGDPYKQLIKDPAQLLDLVKKAQHFNSLANCYYVNAELVESKPELKAAFSKRKSELTKPQQNPG